MENGEPTAHELGNLSPEVKQVALSAVNTMCAACDSLVALLGSDSTLNIMADVYAAVIAAARENGEVLSPEIEMAQDLAGPPPKGTRTIN